MRKGAKRKASGKGGVASSKEEAEAEAGSSQIVQENNQDAPEQINNDKPVAKGKREKAEVNSQPAQKEAEKKDEPKRRAKLAREAKPQGEPEYFEEKRNLLNKIGLVNVWQEDLWRQMVPIGTEWEQVDLVYRYNWSFKNLEDAFEEGGKLYGKKVYLFQCTEPQYVPVQDERKLVIIPVVVAVASPFPPSDKIGIASVQRESKEIVPMKQMKMDWVPYIPLENRDHQVERLKSQIFILGCTQRRAGLKHLNEDRVMKFQYCLPYFYQPFKEDEDDDKTDVDILFPVEPPVVCDFDWELDELEEFTDKLIEEEQLSADQKEAFKEFVKEKVREAKKAKREAKEARKKALEEMNAETKAALQNIEFYKFYPVPTPDTPDVSQVKSPFINRYYRNAHHVL